MAKKSAQEVQEKPADNDNRPVMGSTEWTPWVMSQLTADDMVDKYPKCDGLRRIATVLFGPLGSHTHIVEAPNMSNGGRCVAVVSVSTGGTDARSVCGAADVYSGNCDPRFVVHATATAETRAEGRALRKLLCLVKVLTAEEMQGANNDEPNGFSDNRPTSGMLNMLTAMADKVNVDVVRAAENIGLKINAIEDLTLNNARKVFDAISQWKLNGNIPQEVLK